MPDEEIRLEHGSGGEASLDLVKNIFLSRISNDYLKKLDDCAELDIKAERIAFTTDSYVIDPIFFPGGDIGSLSVHGTVNDLCMQGARPLFLTLALILEEGFPLTHLCRIVDSIAAAAERAGVQIVAGDTKVVPRGHADKIFINTSGIGVIPQGISVGASNAHPGDIILINGPIGDHGMTILTQRESLNLATPLTSDSAPLNALVADLCHLGSSLHVLRDPTRGGVATALNEIARQSGTGILLHEAALPFSPGALAAAEILGLDPLYLANEGKALVFTESASAQRALGRMQRQPQGKAAGIIGEVTETHPGRVLIRTRVGGTRILPMLAGQPLPRIC